MKIGTNEDRHDENLLVDRVSNPREMHVYDHDQALLGGGGHFRGIERLKALRERLGITGSSVTGGSRHVFLNWITSSKSLYDWCDRIRDIPNWFVESVCQEANRHGLAKRICKEVAYFLQYRKDKIRSLIEANKDAIAIGDWQKQRSMFE